MIRTCPACKHSKAPTSPPLFEIGPTASPGELAAAKTWLDLQKERAETEQRLVEQNDAFFFVPQFFPWCERYTLGETKLALLRRALKDGDETPLLEARDAGFDFAIDFANGEIRAAFALCLRKNPQGQCAGFERAERRT